MSAHLEIRVDPVTQCHKSKLGQPRRLRSGELRLSQVLEHVSAPQAQRFAQNFCGAFSVTGSQSFVSSGQHVFEPDAVDLVAAHKESIAGLLGDQHIVDSRRRQVRSKPRHVSPQRAVRTRRRCATPDGVGYTVRRQAAAGMEQQHRKQFPLLGAAQIDRLTANRTDSERA
nr:hypothetical protein [Mycobacterium lehmannii]